MGCQRKTVTEQLKKNTHSNEPVNNNFNKIGILYSKQITSPSRMSLGDSVIYMMI